ncbi:MAG: flavodoxin [Spirochaetes bacterium]|nr:flavodoxin [Spirochaetota bacterium]
MGKTGIFYGSTTGNTEAVAQKIQEILGDADLISIDSAAVQKMTDYENLILGSSTWGLGDLQDNWEPVVSKLSDLDLNGKKVAFFGTGDQAAYPDTFVDAIGIIYDAIANSNAKFVGTWPKDGYDYSESKAEIDGQLIGLAIDDDNQSNLTDQRVKDWVASIKSEL